MSNTYFLSSEIASGYAFYAHMTPLLPRLFLCAALPCGSFAALDRVKKLLDVLSGVQRV